MANKAKRTERNYLLFSQETTPSTPQLAMQETTTAVIPAGTTATMPAATTVGSCMYSNSDRH